MGKTAYSRLIVCADHSVTSGNELVVIACSDCPKFAVFKEPVEFTTLVKWADSHRCQAPSTERAYGR